MSRALRASEKALDRMLLTLADRGFVTLDPPPPPHAGRKRRPRSPELVDYQVIRATPTPALDKLLVFRSVHPLYGAFLLDQLGIADRDERLQALESVLEMPRPLLRMCACRGPMSCRRDRWRRRGSTPN